MNVWHQQAVSKLASKTSPLVTALLHALVYARHGRDCYGVQVPCTRLGVSRSSVYQMTAPIDKVRGEGNCGRVTDRGEEGLLSLKTLWAKLAPLR